MEESDIKENEIISVTTITQLISLALFISVLFALVYIQIYYYFLLHVPIFQYLEFSEIPLVAPGIAITWFFYIGALALDKYIRNTVYFTTFQKYGFRVLIAALIFFYMWVGWHNDPNIKEMIKLPWTYKWWFIPGIGLFVTAYNHKNDNGPVLLQKNKLIIIIALTIWYAGFNAFCSYQIITTEVFTNNVAFKTKSGEKIITNNNLIDAGRTKGFWFLYNRKKRSVRVIKADEIEIADFNIENK